jgi:hypothetical protein
VMRPGGLFPRPRREQVRPRVASEAPLLFSLPPSLPLSLSLCSPYNEPLNIIFADLDLNGAGF